MSTSSSKPSPSASSGNVVLGAPLATSVSTTLGSWATIPMGHLDDPANTFWEVFSLPAGATTWAAHTPPDVADNGGLVAAPTSTGVVVGFRPSDLLKFSPLASTADGGVTYTTGLVPGALSAVQEPARLRFGSVRLSRLQVRENGGLRMGTRRAGDAQVRRPPLPLR